MNIANHKSNTIRRQKRWDRPQEGHVVQVSEMRFLMGDFYMTSSNSTCDNAKCNLAQFSNPGLTGHNV